METYIALLRGINVGGHRKIKMDDLKEMFHDLGFKNVTAYIQSGNVIFDASESKRNALSHVIMQKIKDTFGHDVPVIIRSPAELERTLKEFPFKEKEGWKGYISFLSDKPVPERAKELETMSTDIEKFAVKNIAVCTLVDKGTPEKPLFSNNFIEKKLGNHATSRNLRTVRKILEFAQD